MDRICPHLRSGLAGTVFRVPRFLLSILFVLGLLSTVATAQDKPVQLGNQAATVKAPSGAGGIFMHPVRTDGPRQTLASLFQLKDELEQVLISYQTKRDVQHAVHVYLLGEQLRSLIDLSSVPKVLRREVGNETLGYLFDIFARIEIPKLDDIPDGNSLENQSTALYNIPGTPLQLVRISQGSRTGEFLFNEQSIEIAPRFLRGIENLPVQSTGPIKSWSQTLPQLAGPLVPAALVSNIPGSLTTLLLGTPIWKEMVVVLISAVAVLLLVFWRRAIQAGIREHRLAHQLRRIMVPVATLVFL